MKYNEKVKDIANKIGQIARDIDFDLNNDNLDDDKISIYVYSLNYYGRILKRTHNKKEKGELK